MESYYYYSKFGIVHWLYSWLVTQPSIIPQEDVQVLRWLLCQCYTQSPLPSSLFGLATGKHKPYLDEITLESDETIYRSSLLYPWPEGCSKMSWCVPADAIWAALNGTQQSYLKWIISNYSYYFHHGSSGFRTSNAWNGRLVWMTKITLLSETIIIVTWLICKDKEDCQQRAWCTYRASPRGICVDWQLRWRVHISSQWKDRRWARNRRRRTAGLDLDRYYINRPSSAFMAEKMLCPMLHFLYSNVSWYLTTMYL